MIPSPLTPGQKIGVMAPSSYVEPADIEKSKARLEAKGYGVFIHPQTFERHNQSAGTYLQKAMALQGLWQRDDIDAIWLAGGGNRALGLLDMINWDKMKDKPKAMIGFSDCTALLNALHAHTDMVTFHGPVFKQLHALSDHDFNQCLSMMAGTMSPVEMTGVDILQEGKAKGPLHGGCLSLYHLLAGTKDAQDTEGAILFLEDASDHISRIDRMILQLKRHGVFKKISGLVLGEFIDMQDGQRPFGFSLEDIILEALDGRTDIPIIDKAGFGHGKRQMTLPIGMNAILETTGKNSARLTFLPSPNE